MKKKFKCEIDCADCAAKLENALKKIDGVEEVSVNFIMQKLTLTADESVMDAVVAQMLKTAKKIEPDTVITEL